jgi:hypothetical protein
VSDDLTLSEADLVELLAILDTPTDQLAHAAAMGEKRGRCKDHRTCRSIKWGSMYRALRRKGKSKKNAAQISNAAYNRWKRGQIVRRDFT